MAEASKYEGNGSVSWESSAEDFGQKVDLTVRIREILRNYPEGLSILKELIQNADDAGARTVRFCTAESRPTVGPEDETKLSHLMKGPSLLAYNSAKFTERDLRSIQRIGDSLKKDAKGSKTGRFGVGVNSTYHLTDVPMFVSGTKCVLFDPQAIFVPGINPANPGKLIDSAKENGRALISKLPHVFDPLRVFGCQLNSNDFNGTTFRFALRTPEYASVSRLSRQSHSLNDMQDLLKQMASAAPNMLLFLKNVECIEIYHWSASQKEPTLTHQTKLVTSENLRQKRSYVLNTTSIPDPPQPVDYVIDIESKCIGLDDEGVHAHGKERWIVCNQLGGGRASQMAKDKNLSHMKLIPWAGVAARVSPPCDIAAGTAYCFLPLPVQTGMPIHVNGYFELSSNRRDIWWGEDMAGDGKSRAMWNHSILSDIAAMCYCRLVIMAIKSGNIKPNNYEVLFPQKSLSGPWQVLGDCFFSGIKNLPVLYSKCSSPENWVTPTKSLLLHDENDPLMAEILSHEKLPLVLFQSSDLKNMLLSKQTCQNTTSPPMLRQYFSQRKIVENGALEIADRRIQYAEYLLTKCISDLNPSQYTKLEGCPFIPLADGNLKSFRILPKINSRDLKVLQSMGFAKLSCMHSIRMFQNDLDAAMEWLLAHRYENSVTMVQDDLDPFILCDGQSAALLSVRAADTFIHKEQIEDTNLQKFFSAVASNGILNVISLEPDMLADVVMRSIPEEWRGCDSALWEKDKLVTSNFNHPTVEWFIALWRYICSCNDIGQSISAVAEQYCIVPTMQEIVCNLSPSATVLHCLGLDHSFVKALTSLGVRELYPNIFPKDIIIPREIWSYIFEPTRDGVVKAIDGAIRRQKSKCSPSTESKHLSLLDLSPKEVKDCIRTFLIDSKNGPLSKTSKLLLRQLPIFLAYKGDGSSETFFTSFVKTSGDRLLLDDPIESDYPLLTSTFFSYQNIDEMQLLLTLGAKMIGRAEFYRKFLLPRVSNLDKDVRNESFRHILLNITKLSSDDPEIKKILSTTKFIDCENSNSSLKSPCELYDPEIPQLRSLMGSDFFPSEFYTKSNSLLLSLRNLGLQNSLTWDVILQCAYSIEKEVTDGSSGGNDIAKARGKELLVFLDTNSSTFFPNLSEKKHESTASRLFRSVNKVLFEDPDEIKREEKDQLNRIQTLLSIRWMPVYTEPLHPFLPWHYDCQPVASPLETSTKDNMWLNSYSKRLVDCDVRSVELKKLFGWDKPVTLDDIALQLKMFAKTYSNIQHQIEDKIDINSKSVNDLKNEISHDQTDLFSINMLRQTYTSELPRIYQILNSAKHEFEKESIKKVLDDSAWLWMGDGFVSPDRVAYTSPFNAIPYLYTIPPDLACFRDLLDLFGIRKTFGSSDYCQALQRMAAECGSSDTHQLALSKIELAVNFVQALSDDVMKLRDLEIYVPSTRMKLLPASTMVYDDAPWLSKDISGKKDLIYCHQKISAVVAEKIGVKSIRALLIRNSSNLIQFGEGVSHEAFGQSEALTRRLKNIIEMYPEGPQQLSELVQNADDAKSTIVRFVFSEKTHGEASLLGKNLAVWQGPSLLVYNDGIFSRQDFENLSKIGQASKLERLVTTGRFGLGFNSVFHWTDVPSIVSGDHLVMFDPHAKYVPGATSNSRGIKIKFTGSSLIQQFPDQMKPYCLFGNNMKDRFEGTLFRFPFRNKITAVDSEISKNKFFEDGMIDELMKSFKTVIPKFLLFLRHVNRIEVYKEQNSDENPQLQYYAEVTNRTSVESNLSISSFPNNIFGSSSTNSSDWNAISKFLSGPSSQLLSKEAIYSKLLRTPETRLPKTKHIVSITFFNRQALAEVTNKEKDGNDALIGSNLPNDDKWGRKHNDNIITDEYLVCSALGAGECRKMACDPKFCDMKFLPWAGVAAHLSRNESDAPLTKGNAFCFLPLPAETGLPVHVNGYFELSANRRDIWHGVDMTGAGQVRSTWNNLLLKDVISPLYCEVLLTARKLLGQRSTYYQLWPINPGSSVWNIVIEGLYKVANDMPLLYTPQNGGSWVPPNLSFVIDAMNDDDKRFEHLPEHKKRLTEILLKEKLNVVNIPSTLIQMLQRANCQITNINPQMVRSLLKKTIEHSCLKNGSDALFLLRYCIDDINEQKDFQELIGLPLIPLCSGSLGTITVHDSNESNHFFAANKLENEILYKASSRLINVWTEDDHINNLLKNESFHEMTNLKNLKIHNFVSLLSHLYPSSWHGETVVQWFPSVESSERFTINSKDWISSIWDYIALGPESNIVAFLDNWQIVPGLIGCKEHVLLQLSHDLPLVSPINSRTCLESLDDDVMDVLHCIGIKTLDVSILKEKYRISLLRKLEKFVQTPTTHGIVAALLNSLSNATDKSNLHKQILMRFRHLSDSGKESLRNFLTDSSNFEKGKVFDENHTQVLRALPIYLLYNNNSTLYGDLIQDRYLPPACAEPSLLDCKFVKATSQTDVNLLGKIGIKTMSPTHYYELHVCPCLEYQENSDVTNDLALKSLLNDIPKLQKDSNGADWLMRVSEFHIIPNRYGNLLRAKDLYDPSVIGFGNLLDKSMLPRENLNDVISLNSLRMLGLKTELSSEGVIDCAKSIELSSKNLLNDKIINEDKLGSIRERAIALLHFLDNDEVIENMIIDSPDTASEEVINHKVDGNPDSVLSENRNGNEFLYQLNTLRWLPVEHNDTRFTSQEGLPRNKNKFSALGISSPQETRPKADEWSCSSSMDIFSQPLRSKALMRCFKWDVPPPLMSVSQQIIALSESRKIRTKILARVMPSCYEIVNSHLQTASIEEKGKVLNLFREKSWIWVGDGFVPLKRVAFDAPDHASPYLYKVPKEMTDFKALLQLCDIQDSFSANDFVSILSSLAIDLDGAPCDDEQIDLAIFVARYLGRLPQEELKDLNRDNIYLPSQDKRMYVAKNLTYDDAPWLSAIINTKGKTRHIFVNNDINIEIAAKLGTKSLRDVLSARQNGMAKIPCPKKESLVQLFSNTSFDEKSFCRVILDLMEVAEVNRTKRVSVMIDRRYHDSLSILHPCLSNTQGPSVSICFHDVALEVDQIVKLTSPSKYYSAAVNGENGCGGQGFPRFGRGFCDLFSITDCLQVLSGDSLIFFDPTGEYFVDESFKGDRETNDKIIADDAILDEQLEQNDVCTKSTKSTQHLKPSARNYCVNSSICTQFPDQFKPFFSLPFGAGEAIMNKPKNGNSSCFKGTIIRLPLRSQNETDSSICDITFDDDSFGTILKTIQSRLPSSFIFTQHLHTINVDEWPSSADSFSPILRSRVTSSLLSRQNYFDNICNNTKWRKESESKLKKMFKSSWVPLRTSHTLEISSRQNDEEGDVVDTFIIQSILAPSRLREMANTEALKQLNLIPVISLAAHIHSKPIICESKVKEYNIPEGEIFVGLNTGIKTGLPFLLNAPLFLNEWSRNILLDSEDDAALKKTFRSIRNVTVLGKNGRNETRSIALCVWNRQALVSAMKELIPSLLKGIRDFIQLKHSRDSCQFYRFWPYHSRICTRFQQLMPDSVYSSLTTEDMALYLTDNDGFQTVGKGYFASPDYPIYNTAVNFFLKQTPMFTVPKLVIDDLTRLGVSTKMVTPSFVRQLLKNDKYRQYLSTRPIEAHSVLQYCLADVAENTDFTKEPVFKYFKNELRGLGVIPLSDGSVGTFGRQIIIASPEQQSLLPNLKSKFIAYSSFNQLEHHFNKPGFLDVCGFTMFDATTLAHNISSILPSAWKGKDFVAWSNSSQEGNALFIEKIPTRLWMYRFWKQISIIDHDTIQLFRDWPLIPTTSGELASCANARYILHFCFDDSFKSSRKILIEVDTKDREQVERNSRREMVTNAAMKRLSSSKNNYNKLHLEESFWKMGELIDVTETDNSSDKNETPPSNETESVENRVIHVDNTSERNDTSVSLPEGQAFNELKPNLRSTGYDSHSLILLSLYQILFKLRCPLLDISFFPYDELQHLLPQDRLDASRRIISTLNQCNDYWVKYGEPAKERLLWSQIEPEEYDTLKLALSEHQGIRISLLSSDLESFRRLPIFETLGKKRVSLSDREENFTIDESVDISRLDDYLSISIKEKFLVETSKFKSLYNDLKVESLNEGRILTKFVLPIFTTMPYRQKETVCNFIFDNWEHLIETTGFLDILKETPFVKRTNPLGNDIRFVKAKEVYDPRNHFLSGIFEKGNGCFPAEEFENDDWLNKLKILGLKNEIDKNTFLYCAREVEARNNPEKAIILFKYYSEHFADFYNDSLEFIATFRDLRCVPGSMNDGPISLHCFDEIAVPRDRNLIFRVLPVIPESYAPPQVMLSSLGIESPPSIGNVLRQVRDLIENDNELDHWIYKHGSIEEVFACIFSFLQDNFSKLSPLVQSGLCDRPIVPFGTTLVKASRLFFRLPKDLSPFFFEVPRAFGAYDNLLRNLGVRESPKWEDYAHSLSELYDDIGSGRLNPNELKSVIEVLNLIATEDTNIDEHIASPNIYAPDSSGRLANTNILLENDCDWIVQSGRLDLNLMSIVHPKISSEVCSRLGIGKLSHSLSEIMEHDFIPKLTNEDNLKLRRIEVTLRSDIFADILATLVSPKYSLRVSSLRNINIVSVEAIRTRFILRNQRKTSHIDVTNLSCQERSYCYLNDDTMFMAQLPLGLTCELAIASSLCDFLSMERKYVAGLSAIISSDHAAIPSIKKAMGLIEFKTCQETLRGEPGQYLSNTDLELSEIKPLKVFHKGEIVAVKDSDNRSKLIYGTVSDSGGGTSISRLRVCVGKGKEIVALTSDVRSFKSGSKDKEGDEKSSNQIKLQHLISNEGILQQREKSNKEEMESSLIVGDIGTNGRKTTHALDPVDKNDILSAVQDLLHLANLSLNDNIETIFESNLSLKDEMKKREIYTKSLIKEGTILSNHLAKGIDAFLCPITREIMIDPVICCDGHTYEREAIEMWLRSNSRSPKTNQPLHSRILIPNHAMRNSVESFRENEAAVTKFVELYK